MSTVPTEMSLGDIQEVVAQRCPDRDALWWRGRSLTHSALAMRSRRLANLLIGRGLGNVIERHALEPWESGQDFVGLYMRNRPEYIEAMFGSLKARCVPYNINYRYSATEIAELFRIAPTRAIVYESCFADVVASVRASLPPDAVLIEVTDGSPPHVDEALDYNDAIATSSPAMPKCVASPDDLYVVFTGGTTGRPKPVLWRQADAYVSALSGFEVAHSDASGLAGAIRSSIRPQPRVALAAPPFMHGGGQWVALGNVLSGDTVAIQSVVDRLDCVDLWSTVVQKRVTMLLITGDAYGVPLADELAVNAYDLSSLKVIITGAVAMSHGVKQALLAAIPGVRIVETIASTESGTNLRSESTDKADGRQVFLPSRHTVVLDEARSRPLAPGHSGAGWLARTGRIPLGYLGDIERTHATFPSIGGVRHAVPGDRAKLLATGEVQFIGRESNTINSGGEKIFAEEVEAAIAADSRVYDVIVTSKAHPRWGDEVVAIVRLRAGTNVTEEELKESVASRLARYKTPKRFVFVDAVRRNDVGKPDYDWARDLANKL
jgi:acyl-CoA synthetase (AMP-forming)/AMP-acid ligase II